MITRIKKQSDFSQMDKRSYLKREIITDKAITNEDLRLLSYMCTFSKKEEFSQKLASEALGMCLVTISKCVKRLQEQGYITLENQGDRYIYTIKV